MEAPLFEDNELEKAIGLKYNLDVTPTDLANFDHYTAAQKQFLVSFTLRWRNKALDKTKAVLQNAFQMIHDRVRANKHAALVKQNAELLQNSLDILLSPKDAAHERTPENVNLITEWLHKIRISNEKLHLSDEQLKILATSMDALSLDASETLFIQGDSGKRDYYYWIVTGAVGMFSSHSAAAEVALRSKFKIWNRKTPLSVESTADLGDLIATFHDGDGFGELAVMDESQVRALSACTTEPTVIVRVDKATYNQTLVSMHTEKRKVVNTMQLMKKLSVFQKWTSSSCTHVSYKMEEVVYSYGDTIVKFGDKLREIFFIVDGECTLSTKVSLKATHLLDSASDAAVIVADVYAGCILGDQEVVLDHHKHHKVTATVKSATCTVLAMSKKDFVTLVLKAPDETGEMIRQACVAVKAFREERLASVQRDKRLEKRDKNEKKFGENNIVSKMRAKIERNDTGARGSFVDTPLSKRTQPFHDVKTRGGRRSKVRTFAPGDFSRTDFQDVDALPELNPKPGNLSPWPGLAKLQVSQSSKQLPSAVSSSVDPFLLPGLRDNNNPTTPRTLRRLKSRSMTEAMKEGAEHPPSDGTHPQILGFAHYGTSLNSSFRDFESMGNAGGNTMRPNLSKNMALPSTNSAGSGKQKQRASFSRNNQVLGTK